MAAGQNDQNEKKSDTPPVPSASTPPVPSASTPPVPGKVSPPPVQQKAKTCKSPPPPKLTNNKVAPAQDTSNPAVPKDTQKSSNQSVPQKSQSPPVLQHNGVENGEEVGDSDSPVKSTKSLLSVKSDGRVVENGSVPQGGGGGVAPPNLSPTKEGSTLSPNRSIHSGGGPASSKPSLKDDDDTSSEIVRVEEQAEADEKRRKTALGRLARTLRAFDVSRLYIVL